jgi:hypothetical protein
LGGGGVIFVALYNILKLFYNLKKNQNYFGNGQIEGR